MKPFAYTRAASESEACALLGDHNALALAGGTSLLSLLKDDVLAPELLVDLKEIAGLDRIEVNDDGARIGATVTLADLVDSKQIAEGYPALHQAASRAGGPQIRNRGTIGGDLCGAPACWYMRQQSCVKTGGEGCPAREGENEFHAIYGTSEGCVAVHSSSTAAALLAHGAKVRIAGPKGSREVMLGDFFSTADPKRENVLAANEIVAEVVLGKANRHAATYIVSQKAANDLPISTASVALDLAGGSCSQARVYLGAVARVPYHAAAAERALAGKRITTEVADSAAAAAVADARPLSQNGYKVATARAAVKRAILQAAGLS